MQRDRRYRVELLVTRERVSQPIAQRAREGLNPAVLIKMDQFPERALVGAEAIGCVKTAKAAAAQTAAAFGIQGIAIYKGRPTTYTEKLSIEGPR